MSMDLLKKLNNRTKKLKVPSASSIRTSINEYCTIKKIKNLSGINLNRSCSLEKQNQHLQEENKLLKRELEFIRNHFSQVLPHLSSSIEINDLRGTIKKEAGEMSDMKIRIQILTKQCQVHQEVIEMMECKIQKLAEEKKKLERVTTSEKVSAAIEKRRVLENKKEKTAFLSLQDKLKTVMSLYQQLEHKVKENDLDWEQWKEQWSKQKQYYLHRIHDLQGMLGFGSDPKTPQKDSIRNQRKRS